MDSCLHRAASSMAVISSPPSWEKEKLTPIWPWGTSNTLLTSLCSDFSMPEVGPSSFSWCSRLSAWW